MLSVSLITERATRLRRREAQAAGRAPAHMPVDPLLYDLIFSDSGVQNFVPT